MGVPVAATLEDGPFLLVPNLLIGNALVPESPESMILTERECFPNRGWPAKQSFEDMALPIGRLGSRAKVSSQFVKTFNDTYVKPSG